MILVPRRYMVLLLALSAGLLLAGGIYGYLAAQTDRLAAPDGGRFFGETLLFVSIVSTLSVSAVFLLVFRRSVRVFRELDKLVELTRLGHRSPEESLRRMGPLGERLEELYRGVNDLSHRKSIRISSLSGLVKFFLANVRLPVLILDVTGRVTAESRVYLERTGTRSEGPESVTAERLVPGLSFPEVLRELQRSHAPAERDYGAVHLTFVPIFNRAGEISDVICVFGTEELHLEQAGNGEPFRPANRMRGFFRNLFGPAARE